METRDYLRILKDDMHSTVMATNDSEGRPVTRVIDIMLADDSTLYFLTARGKEFYDQLTEQRFVSVTGVCGGEGMDKREATLHMKAITIRGTVESIGSEKLTRYLRKTRTWLTFIPTRSPVRRWRCSVSGRAWESISISQRSPSPARTSMSGEGKPM
jgi:uncharacterized pyridoxamine 5'-phosphate oxidase family protein